MTETNEQYTSEGISLFQKEQYDEAVKCLDKAIIIDPNNAYSWSWRGHSLYLLKRYEEAIKSYNTALSIDPDEINSSDQRDDSFLQVSRWDANSWSCLGHSHYLLGHYEDAVKSLDKSLLIDPNHAAVWYNRG